MYARGMIPSRDIRKQNQQIAIHQQLSRMPAAQPSHSPGHWKKYIANDSRMKGGISRNNSQGNFNTYQAFEGALQLQKRQMGGPLNIDKYQQQKKRKQQMKKRVQEIQRKVLPILKAQKNNQEQEQDFGWYNRMEQRIMKLETNIDSIQKQMQIKIQKRLLSIEREWEHRIQTLLSSQNKKAHKILKTRVENIELKAQQYLEEEVEQGQNQQVQKKDRIYKRSQTPDEGYYTKRQNENKRNCSDQIRNQQRYLKKGHNELL